MGLFNTLPLPLNYTPPKSCNLRIVMVHDNVPFVFHNICINLIFQIVELTTKYCSRGFPIIDVSASKVR